jgi:1,2-phenylacetyl-CoA epoxidase PaaB subunit
MIYEIFARKTRGEPLRHIGNLNAPDDDLARVYAFNTYDEEKWFDMYVVPRDRFLEVFNRLDSELDERSSAPAERPGGGSARVSA